MPDLLRVAEEVAATKKPLKLTRDRKTVAILMPVSTSLSPRKKPEKTRADYEAFSSAAGGWKDVDIDRLIANIYATCRRSNRPPVNL